MLHDSACVFFCICVCASTAVTERERTLLGKLFDIHVEDVINRKQ